MPSETPILTPTAAALALAEAKLLGASRVMVRLRQELARLALLPWPVRIEGEIGTGKTVAAALLHALSRRAHAAFMLCSLAGLPDASAAADLVGWRRGAFTDAREDHAGKIEQAHGGTLCLDEAATLGPACQEVLLQPLGSGVVMRLGETRSRNVDVRIVVATQESLEHLVARGRFRLDLLSRLGNLRVRMPALREHIEDLPLLVDHLLPALAAEAGVPVPHLGDRHLARLMAWRWPDNVRGLRNALQHFIWRGRLPDEIRAMRLGRVERARIAQVLAACRGNKSAAARALGLSRRQLYRSLEA